MNDASGGVPTCYRHPDRETYIRCQRCDRPICPDCMRDAAVGFQCPTCVAQGAKETRSGRTAYGGRRSANPALTSYVLIAINAAVWVAIVATGWHASRLVDRLALTPVGLCGSDADPGSFYPGATSEALCDRVGTDGAWLPGVADGAYWQLITSAFAHVEIWHIAFNMLALWFLGPQLELALGRARFLALYLVSGLAGSVVVLWFANETTATLGASGAIFGLMGGLLVVAQKVGGDVQGLIGWLAINAVLTFLVPSVSWQGHLGGFVGGLIVAAVLIHAPRARRTPLQVAGISLVTVALLGAAAARVVALA